MPTAAQTFMGKRRRPLWLEIVAVVLLKSLILYGLWLAFFTHPQAPHMLLPAPQVEQHLLSSVSELSHVPKVAETSLPPTVSPSSQLKTEVNHGSH